MANKLTLTLDEAAIKIGKQYAKKHHVSLSKLIERFLKLIGSSSSDAKDNLPLITRQLSGSIKKCGRVKYKRVLADAVAEKYL